MKVFLESVQKMFFSLENNVLRKFNYLPENFKQNELIQKMEKSMVENTKLSMGPWMEILDEAIDNVTNLKSGNEID